jgi:hypothetical protein
VTARNHAVNLETPATAASLAERGYAGCKRCGAHELLEKARSEQGMGPGSYHGHAYTPPAQPQSPEMTTQARVTRPDGQRSKPARVDVVVMRSTTFVHVTEEGEQLVTVSFDSKTWDAMCAMRRPAAPGELVDCEECLTRLCDGTLTHAGQPVCVTCYGELQTAATAGTPEAHEQAARPSAETVAAVSEDADLLNTPEAHEEAARKAYELYVRHNNCAVELRAQGR